MSFTRLRYHFVTGTKRRRPFITPELEPILHELMEEEAENGGGRIIEIGGTEDHVHLVAAIRPDASPSKFMQQIKGATSRRLHAEYDDFDAFEWQTGFGGFTLSPFNLERVREYVRHQKEHHREESIWEKFELLRELEEAA